MRTERLEGISEEKNDFCVVCAADRTFVYIGYHDSGDRIEANYRCVVCNVIVHEIIRRKEIKKEVHLEVPFKYGR